MAHPAVEFQFERGQLYPISELRAFEAKVSSARQSDPELTKLLRVPRGPVARWMRLRNKELVPLKLFAEHIGASDEDQFLLMPEGDAIDAQIVVRDQTLNLQFTLTAPIWEKSGYQHHQVMDALNDFGMVVGHPPFSAEHGVAIGAVGCVTSEDRDRACAEGLRVAIDNKAKHDGRGCTLAVFAQEFYLQLLEVSSLSRLVQTVLGECSLSFDSVCIFDSHPGFFVQFPGRR